ncbi:glutathione transferase GstA [Paracoccus sp. S-4012]|uniref:glutathione transferase GstA n=1 Tax=Paracoccus sp. S-4012 TaxID=2665648 RepID=UPI0012AFF212|nr:glutathione transferase GstA [Paracoccus sp. S-4012]MRX49504.1 glutathione transferase GstA [Paracoccus sp. S-4012]
MKLYIKPGACSLASHIVLHELGLPHETEVVDTAAKRTASGEDYLAINPKGVVPALRLDGGEVLTEGPAILQFLADSAGNESLAPKCGTLARARVQEVLNFTGTGLHAAFKPMFSPASDEATKAAARQSIGRNMAWLEQLLSDGRPYLTGATYTVADAYAFVVANWSPRVGVDLGQWPNMQAFVARVAERPATVKALKAEGLI